MGTGFAVGFGVDGTTGVSPTEGDGVGDGVGAGVAPGGGGGVGVGVETVLLGCSNNLRHAFAQRGRK